MVDATDLAVEVFKPMDFAMPPGLQRGMPTDDERCRGIVQVAQVTNGPPYPMKCAADADALHNYLQARAEDYTDHTRALQSPQLVVYQRVKDRASPWLLDVDVSVRARADVLFTPHELSNFAQYLGAWLLETTGCNVRVDVAVRRRGSQEGGVTRQGIHVYSNLCVDQRSAKHLYERLVNDKDMERRVLLALHLSGPDAHVLVHNGQPVPTPTLRNILDGAPTNRSNGLYHWSCDKIGRAPYVFVAAAAGPRRASPLVDPRWASWSGRYSADQVLDFCNAVQHATDFTRAAGNGDVTWTAPFAAMAPRVLPARAAPVTAHAAPARLTLPLPPAIEAIVRAAEGVGVDVRAVLWYHEEFLHWGSDSLASLAAALLKFALWDRTQSLRDPSTGICVKYKPGLCNGTGQMFDVSGTSAREPCKLRLLLWLDTRTLVCQVLDKYSLKSVCPPLYLRLGGGAGGGASGGSGGGAKGGSSGGSSGGGGANGSGGPAADAAGSGSSGGPPVTYLDLSASAPRWDFKSCLHEIQVRPSEGTCLVYMMRDEDALPPAAAGAAPVVADAEPVPEVMVSMAEATAREFCLPDVCTGARTDVKVRHACVYEALRLVCYYGDVDCTEGRTGPVVREPGCSLSVLVTLTLPGERPLQWTVKLAMAGPNAGRGEVTGPGHTYKGSDVQLSVPLSRVDKPAHQDEMCSSWVWDLFQRLLWQCGNERAFSEVIAARICEETEQAKGEYWTRVPRPGKEAFVSPGAVAMYVLSSLRRCAARLQTGAFQDLVFARLAPKKDTSVHPVITELNRLLGLATAREGRVGGPGMLRAIHSCPFEQLQPATSIVVRDGEGGYKLLRFGVEPGQFIFSELKDVRVLGDIKLGEEPMESTSAEHAKPRAATGVWVPDDGTVATRRGESLFLAAIFGRIANSQLHKVLLAVLHRAQGASIVDAIASVGWTDTPEHVAAFDEMKAFMQLLGACALSYCLIKDRLCILVGPPHCGKTSMLDTLQRVMGSLANQGTANPSVLSKEPDTSSSQAHMFGPFDGRVVFMGELDAGLRVKASVVNNLFDTSASSGIKFRGMNSDTTYQTRQCGVTFTSTNCKPDSAVFTTLADGTRQRLYFLAASRGFDKEQARVPRPEDAPPLDPMWHPIIGEVELEDDASPKWPVFPSMSKLNMSDASVCDGNFYSCGLRVVTHFAQGMNVDWGSAPDANGNHPSYAQWTQKAYKNKVAADMGALENAVQRFTTYFVQEAGSKVGLGLVQKMVSMDFAAAFSYVQLHGTQSRKPGTDLKAIQKDPLFKEWEARIPSIHAAFGNTGPKVSLQWSCADRATRQASVLNVRLKTAAELQAAGRGEEAGPAGAGAPTPGSFAAALEDHAGRM